MVEVNPDPLTQTDRRTDVKTFEGLQGSTLVILRF